MRTARQTTAARCTAWLVAMACGVATLSAFAQGPAAVTISVRETAGIRRTEYPVGTVVSWPRGAVSETARLRLAAGDTAIVAQFTPITRWEDGSLRQVAVDFNTSIGAGETRSLTVGVASETAPVAPAPPRNALVVTEETDRVAVGNVRFGRQPWPLLASVAYRGEIIGSGANGITLTDDSGAAQAFGSTNEVRAEVIKPGPLLAVIRYAGRVALAGGAVATVTLTCEMPNSKSWIKVTADVLDPDRRLRAIRFETPFALGAFPWTWDMGTDSGTYGAFRNAAEIAVLTQRLTGTTPSWQVETGSASDLRIYEQSMPSRSLSAAGWGHLVDARNAIAFAVDRFGRVPGAQTIRVSGDGHLTVDLHLARPSTRHRLTVYEHFVATPVPIGAATSPAAMLQPLAVTVSK